MVTLRIPGKPIAKKRPRFARRGKFVMTYNDQETEEGRVVLEMRQAVKELISCPVFIDIVFYFQRPKSHYGTGKNSKKVKESAPAHHTKKPDLDNLIKFYLDCMNNVMLSDDSTVVSIYAQKFYTEGEPRTMITISKR